VQDYSNNYNVHTRITLRGDAVLNYARPTWMDGWMGRVERRILGAPCSGDAMPLMRCRTDNGRARCRRLAAYCVSLDYRRPSTRVTGQWVPPS